MRKTQYVTIGILVVVFFAAKMCTSRPEGAAMYDKYGHAFAGSAACKSCHSAIYASHLGTAHYHDSRPATAAASIKGSFDSGRNRFVFNPSTAVLMEKRGNRFYQTAYVRGQKTASEAMDIVIGSGRKGQTYLYYGPGGKLFQLPISWSAATDGWCNSPGYYPDSIRYNREVNAYCLECHATFAASTPGGADDEDQVDPSRILYGIDCERCHGPGAEHIRYQAAHPADKKGRYILNARNLSRQQRLDACALCHSGLGVPLKPAFTFRVGDTLRQFYQPGLQTASAAGPEVHGNQYGLLISSKCFQHSGMDCSTCHNVHVREAGNLKLFSSRCMTCHNAVTHDTCTVRGMAGLVLRDNCIDCHMPAQASRKIALQGSGSSQDLLSGAVKASPALVRTHRIAIYPAAASFIAPGSVHPPRP